MLSPEQLTNFKSLLTQNKEQLETRFQKNDQLGLDWRFPQESLGELSGYDNHPGDQGTELFEREKDIALNEHYKLEYAHIENALKAIEDGTYGTCKVCGEEIPLERLEAIPNTTYCINHADQYAAVGRPLEEGVLMPPFGKFDMDGKDENVAYDAEDAWQDTAEHGTSNSPSDFFRPKNLYGDMYEEGEEQVGYVEAYENFIGNDMYGNNITVYPNERHEEYEDLLDEEGIMTSFGDLHPYELDPYVEEDEKRTQRDWP
ncbi:YteA family regulatory protein [Peribacillus deserti]|uniref:YteA family regulatory protein n=1 Tax=Peribacillus deserti TaxID=673318 RepID=A0ABS2QMS8_9BACI|nr:TraR/DksA C4-type zinc finger protein [Peribacillus deserti]MBM7694468.1 YteA family regulatory protein [Peribacillus deserti]